MNDGVLKAGNYPVICAGVGSIVDGTKVTITDGKIIGTIANYYADSGYIACGILQTQNGTLDILGGEFFIDRGVGIVAKKGNANIFGNTKITVIWAKPGRLVNADLSYPTVDVYKDSSDASISITGGNYSTDVSKYLANGYKVVWNDAQKHYEVIAGDTTNYDVVKNKLAIDNVVANNIDKCLNYTDSFNKEDEIVVDSEVFGLGDTFELYDKPCDFSEWWDESEEKVELTKFLSTQEHVSDVVPLGIRLIGQDASLNIAYIQTLTKKANATLFLDEDTLSEVEGKKYTLYRFYNDGNGYSITPVTEEKTSLVDNAIPFSSDKFTCIYAIVTYAEPTSTPETKKSSSKSTGGWDDGGPFTTDTCGNVFDRWGNKIYEAKGCNVGGYNLVRTSVED